jgi:hypothetical protein
MEEEYVVSDVLVLYNLYSTVTVSVLNLDDS